jgi:hypothetical protein
MAARIDFSSSRRETESGGKTPDSEAYGAEVVDLL